MNIEHFALHVREPAEMAKWYVAHLGMKIVKKRDESPYTTFLSDTDNNVMVEIYCHPEIEVLDYRSMSPSVVHLAFTDNDPDATRARLIAVGAELLEEVNLQDGSRLVMMRDPWGLAIQFCKRSLMNS